MILSLNKWIYASFTSQKFCVVVRTKHRWLAHMQKVHRAFAGRPLKLKWIPVLPIFLAFSRFPRHFEGQRYAADVLYIASYSKNHRHYFNLIANQACYAFRHAYMLYHNYFHNENELLPLVSGRNTIFMYN